MNTTKSLLVTKELVEQYEDSFKHSNHDEGQHDYHLCKE